MQDEIPQRDGSKILNILRERIQTLELSPGSILDENGLASMLSVSRTPVREAIIQLISEGLAIRDGRFARVAPLNFDDVPRLYEALLVSSRIIIRLAAEHRTAAELKQMKAAHSAFERNIVNGDDRGRQEANVRFHLAIANAAHNGYFFEFYHKTFTASSRLARACFSGAGDKSPGRRGIVSEKSDPRLYSHLMETSRQHALMIKAIENRNADEADRLAVEHHKLACERIKYLMFSFSPASVNLVLRSVRTAA